MKNSLIKIFTLLTIVNCNTATADTYTLDAKAATDDPQNKTFKTVAAALNALPDGTATNPTILVVRPGVYWLDDPDDPTERRPAEGDGSVPYAQTLRTSHLQIVGDVADPTSTIWAVNRGQTQGAYGNFTMLKVTGSDIVASGITFGNYCNVDLEYPQDPSQNRPRRDSAIVQAQIAICHGSDRLHFKNCRFVSRLNLCPFVGARRVLYENCHFESTDDAFCGTGLYVGCHFVFFSGKPFYSTSRTGAILLDCDIESRVRGTQYFTKIGGPLTLVDTRITGPDIENVLWSKADEPYVCYVSNVSLNGRPVDIDPERTLRTSVLSHEGLKAYKNDDGTYNIAGLTAGADGWNPTGGVANIRPTTLVLTPNTIDATPQNGDITLRADQYTWGSPEPQKSWSHKVAVSNDTWREVRKRIGVDGDYDLRAVGVVNVGGLQVQTPALREQPSITRDKRSNELKLDYKIGKTAKTDAIGNEDISLVSWMRIEKNGDTTVVKECRDSWTKNIYAPTRADRRHKMVACIVPQIRAGGPTTPIETSTKCKKADIRTDYIHTDFADVAIRHHTDLTRRGVWLMDAHKPADTEGYDWTAESSAHYPAWRYGTAPDGATGRGLVTERRGARLTYNPAQTKCQRMAVKIAIDPCKGAGQGFGSATGQYLDIRVKNDIATGKAIGLRIQRSPKHDKAVLATLMSYDGENATPISDAQVCTNFRTGCEVIIVAEGETLKADIRRDGEKTLTLSSTISPEMRATGLQIQHTGTTGASALMFHSVDISLL